MTGPIQYHQAQDGSWTVTGLDANVCNVEMIQGDEPAFDWLAALDIPKDRDKISAMAVPSGLSQRWLRCIVCDESVTRMMGSFRYQPTRMTFRPSGQLLTLGHLGFAIGIVHWMQLCEPGHVEGVEGAYIMALAELYSSPLADAAWRGIQEQIFQHVCAVVLRPSAEPAGTGEVIEVALTDRPGCPGAKILKTWDYSKLTRLE
jgi:hypothetical protein